MTALLLKWGGILGGWLLAAGAGWIALHEYHVAATQASRDQAHYATAQAQATARALKLQQVIDAAQQYKLQTMADRAQHYAQVQQEIARSAVKDATMAALRLDAYERTQPTTACINQPLPKQVARTIGQ